MWGRGERRGRVKSRNVYKGPTEKDNGAGGGFNVGCGGCVGHGRVMGGIGEGPSRNMYKGPMDKAKGGKFEGGRWGWGWCLVG